VADEHDVAVALGKVIDNSGYVIGVTIEVGQGLDRGAVAGEIGRVRRYSATIELSLEGRPAPSAVPRAVHQKNRS
jgi:hypothetical protein